MNPRMLPALRRENILRLLQNKQSATVEELSELYQVSEVTVRQDLNRLAEEGRLVRMRGGAWLPSRVSNEFPFAARDLMNADAKRRIGELAASLVTSGDSIIVDASTTALYVIRALLTRHDLHDLTIITNGIQAALELVGRPDITTVLTGGILRMTAVSMIGDIAVDMLGQINATLGFFGARGISVEHGLTDVNLQEAKVKMAMINRCQQVIAVADGSKFGEVSLISYAPVEHIQRIITDSAAPPDAVSDLRERGIDVWLA
jgi:DeoR/GlpR family transcriptional regulator of sugar metabolism